MTNLNHTCAHQIAAAVKSAPQPVAPASAVRLSHSRLDQFTPRRRDGRVLLPGSLKT